MAWQEDGGLMFEVEHWALSMEHGALSIEH